jgi:hypothetical protein
MDNRLLLTIIVLIVLIALVVVTSGMAGYTIPFRTSYDSKPTVAPAQSVTPIGASTGACSPTAENPRWRCVPRDATGGACQLGGCLPSEIRGLPPLNQIDRRRNRPYGYESEFSRAPY